MRLRTLPLLVAFCGLSMTATGVQAQERTRARLVGVAHDGSGAVVAGVAIEIRNLDLELSRSAVSDGEGRFAVDGLPPGRYRVSANLSGFEPSVRVLALGGGEEARVDLVLSIARQEAMVVVTADATDRPLTVETDPRAPRQPVPAHDGADYLKTIPGFSIVRKGGTDGDPVLRGMSGSRLGILLDGQQILGGCGGRMDPPTAYVYPAAYDRITVFKGPQTVLAGAGMSAGAVLFERDVRRTSTPGVRLLSSATVGAFGRHDEMADVRASLPSVYLQAVGTRSHTGDYTDGHGTAVHSFYTRWSGSAAFGWTPDDRTVLELSGAVSDGQAAYADRAMDGSLFARRNVAVKFDRHMAGGVVRRLEAQAYYNHIDHVMDNFSLRTPGPTYTGMNPDRQTSGGRAVVTLAPNQATAVMAGIDTQRNAHRTRTAMNKASAALAVSGYESAPRLEDMRFSQVGAFVEAKETVSTANRMIGGLRIDWHRAVDSRACIGTTMCPGNSPLKNDTLGASDGRTLVSAFGRYERSGVARGTFFAGLGHAERFPDYWERLQRDQTSGRSAFLTTRPERTTQLDTGMVWRGAGWSGSVSAFYGKIRDYVLIRWTPTPAVTRNVDATTFGAEADLTRALPKNLVADATLAYVHADNDTDRKPLAQQPPAEARVGLRYDNRVYSLGLLMRVVAAQNRVDVGSGSIVVNGRDLGPTAGFSVFSINGGCRLGKRFALGAGIDNVFDRAYAEHISQAGAIVPGFVQTGRINEPGRTAWLKLTADLR